MLCGISNVKLLRVLHEKNNHAFWTISSWSPTWSKVLKSVTLVLFVLFFWWHFHLCSTQCTCVLAVFSVWLLRIRVVVQLWILSVRSFSCFQNKRASTAEAQQLFAAFRQKVVLVGRTSGAAGPGARAVAGHRGRAAVAAMQAALQHGLHVLVLSGIFGVLDTLRLALVRLRRGRVAELAALYTKQQRHDWQQEGEKTCCFVCGLRKLVGSRQSHLSSDPKNQEWVTQEKVTLHGNLSRAAVPCVQHSADMPALCAPLTLTRKKLQQWLPLVQITQHSKQLHAQALPHSWAVTHTRARTEPVSLKRMISA